MESNNFSLYTVELSSKTKNLLKVAKNFSETAEIDYLNKQNGVVRLQFVSTAKSEDILKMCDDYKKEIEAGDDTRLLYKISRIML